MRIRELDFYAYLAVGGTMRRVFRRRWFRMLKLLEHFADVVWHAQLDGAPSIIPF